MKNLSDFNSFVQSINEAAPWDPKKAQTAIDEIMKRYKENKDAEPTGLSFSNIQKVYGKTDYQTRFKIAQALFLAGKSIFPRYLFGNPSDDDKFYITVYSGKKDENFKMDKISEALLRAVKPIVNDWNSDDHKIGEYTEKTALEKPLVKQAKVAIDKISG